MTARLAEGLRSCVYRTRSFFFRSLYLCVEGCQPDGGIVADKVYGQYCGLAKALDLVGERWTLLIIRELAFGPRRFSDLVEGLRGISTSVLNKRLNRLEDARLIIRRTLPPPARLEGLRPHRRRSTARPSDSSTRGLGCSNPCSQPSKAHRSVSPRLGVALPP
jgi:HxlR-like helix-turn-helix